MIGLSSFKIELLLLLAFLSQVFCKNNARKNLHCGVCKIIVDEIKWDISQVDPRKTLEVEGFRIDSKGNQKSKSIPYARSETHLTEVLENVCGRMNNYAESTDPESGDKTYIRTSSRNGEEIKLENVSISGDISKALKFACESVIEDHEETIINIFKNEQQDEVVELCERQTDLCDDEETEDDDDEHSEL